MHRAVCHRGAWGLVGSCVDRALKIQIESHTDGPLDEGRPKNQYELMVTLILRPGMSKSAPGLERGYV